MEYELKLEEKEVNLVLTGLGQLPFIHSSELIAKIKKTCNEQIEEKE